MRNSAPRATEKKQRQTKQFFFMNQQSSAPYALCGRVGCLLVYPCRMGGHKAIILSSLCMSLGHFSFLTTTRAWEATFSGKRDNASMHSTSTKHGPAHPRDVDDVDERRPHDLDERCTSAPHAQHEGAQHSHAQHSHAQQAWARAPRARTCRRQTARAHRAHSTPAESTGRRAPAMSTTLTSEIRTM